MNWHEVRNTEQRMFQAAILGFTQQSVRPIWHELEERGQWPDGLVREGLDLGFGGITIPQEYGGLGLSIHYSSLFNRDMAYVWPSLQLILSVTGGLAALPFVIVGTEEQKQRHLPRLANGEAIGCYMLTEAEAGSDAASLQLRAEPEGNEWVLNGGKLYITNAKHATLGIVFARTGQGRHDVSAFIIEAEEGSRLEDIPGVSIDVIAKRGLHSSLFTEVRFENVHVSESALLGELNRGFPIAMKTLDVARIGIAAQAVGMAASVFDAALAYTMSRRQFGRSLWENQGVQFDFANWDSEIRAAWALVEQVSYLHDAGREVTEMASCAKLFATVTAKRICSLASEYFGAIGYTQEHWILSRVLDAFAPPLYEGASNIQRIVIARELGKE